MAQSNNKKTAESPKKVSRAPKCASKPNGKHTDRPLGASAKDGAEMPPSSKVKRPVRSDGPADKAVPKRASVSETPVSTDVGSPTSPEAKKLVESHEQGDKAVPERVSASEPPIETSLNSPQTLESKQIDRPEHAAAFPNPVSTNGLNSESILLDIIAQCKESSHEPAQARTEEPSCRPAGPADKAEDPLCKPAPAKHHQDDVFAEAAGPSVRQRIRDKIAGSKPGGRSTKDKVMVMLVPFLAIVMIFMFRQVLHRSPGKAKGAARDETPWVTAADSGHEIEWEIPEPLPAAMRDPLKLSGKGYGQSAYPDNTRNQERDAATGQVVPAVIRIRGLVYSEDKPSVVIGNRIAYEGTRINGVTIVKINRDSVELEKDGKIWLQRMRD